MRFLHKISIFLTNWSSKLCRVIFVCHAVQISAQDKFFSKYCKKIVKTKAIFCRKAYYNIGWLMIWSFRAGFCTRLVRMKISKVTEWQRINVWVVFHLLEWLKWIRILVQCLLWTIDIIIWTCGYWQNKFMQNKFCLENKA